MPERIYLLADQGDLSEMTEERFDAEATLQKLIAEHPELLAGEQIDPHDPPRWILVRREKGIADTSEAAARWAVDHLLIDQNAVPTLVEVKRSDNRELRRTVVGQMLEYAAHASRTWTAEELRRVFERQTEENGAAPQDRLAELLDAEEPDQDGFWDDVATHLAAKRLRLLFVADEIPDELARVVEFLNEQMMPNIEVLAVEIKQFRGDSGQILVPRVIGAHAARPKKPSGRGRVNLTRESFLEAFADERVRSAAAQLLQVADSHGATVAPGVKSVRIRVRCRLWPSPQPLTLAWLYVEPDVKHWYATRDFSFGTAAATYPDFELDEQLQTRLNAWESTFVDEPFAEPIEGDDVSGCVIKHADAAANIETIASRLAATIDDLRNL